MNYWNRFYTIIRMENANVPRVLEPEPELEPSEPPLFDGAGAGAGVVKTKRLHGSS